METFFVYGLVGAFFLFTCLFVIGVLAHHPYTEPPQTVPAGTRGTEQNATSPDQRFSVLERKLAYALLALLFLLLCISTFWPRRKGERP